MVLPSRRVAAAGERSIDGGSVSPVQVFDQAGQQAPEIVLARIAADAADLATVINQYEHRSDAFYCDEIEVGRDRTMDIDPPQRRGLAFVAARVDRPALAVEQRAIWTPAAPEHPN